MFPTSKSLQKIESIAIASLSISLVETQTFSCLTNYKFKVMFNFLTV